MEMVPKRPQNWANVREKGEEQEVGKDTSTIHSILLRYLEVVGGRWENKKRGKIKKLDYKQTNKSTGTTWTAEWQRGCST